MDEDSQERDDPALAFERLRGDVSLLRHAVEALATARESIDIPDYEPTLERTEKAHPSLVCDRGGDAPAGSPRDTAAEASCGS